MKSFGFCCYYKIVISHYYNDLIMLIENTFDLVYYAYRKDITFA